MTLHPDQPSQMMHPDAEDEFTDDDESIQDAEDEAHESDTAIPPELKGVFQSGRDFMKALLAFCKRTFMPMNVFRQAVKSETKELIWKSVTILCAHHGKYRSRVPSGQRQRETFTRKSNCEARIRVVQVNSGLQVKWVNLCHRDHKTTSDDLYAAWPALRKECFANVLDALQYGATFSAVTQKVRQETSIPVTRQDAVNAFKKVKRADASNAPVPAQILAVCEKWRERGASICLQKDSANELASVAIVTKEMKRTRATFCRVLMIDST